MYCVWINCTESSNLSNLRFYRSVLKTVNSPLNCENYYTDNVFELSTHIFFYFCTSSSYY